MYLAPIISQHLDTLHQSQHLGIVFLQIMLWNWGAVHKEWHLLEILGSFGKCNGLWPLQEPHLLRLRYELFTFYFLYHFTFYVIFKLKHVFSSTVLTIHTPNNSLSIIYHENNIQSPIRTYSNIALCEHCIIF